MPTKLTTTPTGYDLILTGGTLLDPGQGIHGRRDVAFKDGLDIERGAAIELADHPNFQEGVSAFLEKRKPDWG